MNIIHLPVRVDQLTVKREAVISLLTEHPPGKRMLVTSTAQFHPHIDQVIRILEGAGITPVLRQGRHTRLPGQVLGCDAPITYEGREKKPAEPIRDVFFLGDGVFHVKELLLQGAERVYAYIPHREEAVLYTRDLIRRDEQHRRAGIAAFHHAERIGVIISLKPGQQYYRFLTKLREAYPTKTYYPIIFDTIDFSQLENFPFIQAYVNAACPRIMDDYDKFPRPVVNIRDLLPEAYVQ